MINKSVPFLCYLKGPEDFNKALTSTALSAGFEKFVVANGFSKEVASKASNALGMANTWDKLADRTLDFLRISKCWESSNGTNM